VRLLLIAFVPLKYLLHIGFEARGHRREGVDIVVRRQAQVPRTLHSNRHC
jgi:hypothetical protein